MKDNNPDEKVMAEVCETMNLLEGKKNIAPDPYLFDRIMIRLQSVNDTEESSLRPKNMAASVILIMILIVNIFSFYIIMRGEASAPEAGNGIKNLKTEYQFLTADYLERITDL